MALDWGWDAFKNQVGGLLTDQERVQGLTENPWFNMGMGLLAENRKPFGGNPAQGMMGALATSRQAKEAGEDRRRREQSREDYENWLKSQGVDPEQAQRDASQIVDPNLWNQSPSEFFGIQDQGLGMNAMNRATQGMQSGMGLGMQQPMQPQGRNPNMFNPPGGGVSSQFPFMQDPGAIDRAWRWHLENNFGRS